MLPFLKDIKKSGGVSVVYRKPDEGKEPESSEDVGMHAAAQDILKAIAEHDHKALAAALRSAHEIMASDSYNEPEEEPSEDSLKE